MTGTEYANSIMAFLQNIDDADDAREFVRIALDALENLAEQTSQFFDRGPIIHLLGMIDQRILSIEE